MARSQWTPARSFGLLIVATLLLLVHLPSLTAAERLRSSTVDAAWGLTEDSTTSMSELNYQEETTRSRQHDDTNRVSEDRTAPVMDSSDAALEGTWDELRVERMLLDYAGPTANTDPADPNP